MSSHSYPNLTRAPDPVEEPLSESAPLAIRFAEDFCRKHPESGEHCSWYHGIWQELRLMNLAVSPQNHSTFFPQAISMVRRGRDKLRILISGAADYAILAHVLCACRMHGVIPEITVIDICQTPLKLNEWYAAKTGISIESLQSDILDYQCDRPFDMICSHSFLGQFDASRRMKIVRHWRQLLANHGAAVTANRIRTETLHDPVRFSEAQTNDFLVTIDDRSGLSGKALEELLGRARRYAQQLHAYAISEQDMTRLFTEAGYSVEYQSTLVSAGTGNTRGLAIPAQAKHACFVAVKPA